MRLTAKDCTWHKGGYPDKVDLSRNDAIKQFWFEITFENILKDRKGGKQKTKGKDMSINNLDYWRGYKSEQKRRQTSLSEKRQTF